MPFYAIAHGLRTGIFTNPDDYNNFKTGRYSCGKKCATEKEAQKYLKEINAILNKEKHAFLDLEFTCANKIADFSDKNHIGEVLSIGVVITNSYGSVIDKFYKTIKPKYNPILTDYCKELTHLKQEEIDASDDLMTVLDQLNDFMSVHKVAEIYCFGNSDYLQTKKDLANYISHPKYKKLLKLVNRFRNCQKQLGRRTLDASIEVSLQDLKNLLNISGDVQHNALSDAIDLSKVYFGSIFNPPSNKRISEYHLEREKKLRYKQLRKIKQNETITFSVEEKENIKKICDAILAKNEHNIEELKIKALVDDLLSLSNQL